MRINLLTLALAELHNRNQWPNGESITIWQNSNSMAWLKNESGWITLTVFRDAAKLTARKYSQPLPVGYYDPQHGLWVESENAAELYPHWVEQTRRLMGV